MTSILSKKVSYLCTVEADFRERNKPGSNLHLTTRFSDDLLTFGPIRIRVALSRAYLNFRLQNCKLPLADDLEQTWTFREKAKLSIKKRITKQEGDGNKIGLIASANPSLKLETATKAGDTSAVETKLETSTKWQHVYWRGSALNPSLVFDSRPSQQFLSGTLLSDEFVGSVEPTQATFHDITIELEIPKSGLLLEDGDEFKSFPNKRGLIKIIAAAALCRRPTLLHKRNFQK